MANFTVKKKLVAVGRDYDVRNDQHESVFTIDGKLRFGRTFDVKDRSGNVLYSAKEKLLALDQTFLINASGESEISVKRTTTGSVNPMKFDIVVDGETRLHAHGSFYREGVDVLRGSARIANVTREPNTIIAEIFHVWIADDENPALMLALAMVIVEGDLSRGEQKAVSTG